MDRSESDKLFPELDFFPEKVGEQEEQMKTLLLRCFQFQQKVMSQKSEITKLKERISDAENIETNNKILQERVSKLNHSIFESTISNEKLCSALQTGEITSETKSFTCFERKAPLSSSSISYLNIFDDSTQVMKYKSELMNTSLGPRMQQCHSLSPIRRSVSLSSLGSVCIHNTDTKQINANFLCPGNTHQYSILQHTYFTTNCKDRVKVKNTSNLSSSKPFFYQVGVEKNVGCKSSGKLNDDEGCNLSLNNNKDNVCPAQEGHREKHNDSGIVSGQTIDSDSDFYNGLTHSSDLDAGKECGSLKNKLPFKEENKNFTLDTFQNIEGKQQNQDEVLHPHFIQEELIFHDHDQDEVKESLESDSAYGGASDLSIDDHSCRSNISQHSREEKKGICEVDEEILPRKFVDYKNSKSVFKLTKDIPVNSLDFQHQFDHLIGKETSIDSNADSEYYSLSTETETTNGNTDYQQTDKVRADHQSEQDPQSFSFAKSDYGVKNAMPKAVNGINSSFSLDLLGQVVSQRDQLQNQTLLPSSQMIPKTLFDKLTQELTKVKANCTEMQKDCFMMYMQMQNMHPRRNAIDDGEENAQMNIDLEGELSQNKAAPMYYADDDQDLLSSSFILSTESQERDREEQEQNKAAQMQYVDEPGLHKLSIPRTKQSEQEKEPSLLDEAFEKNAAQVQYMRDLEKKIESLHTMLGEESRRSTELSRMLDEERKRFARDIKHLKKEREKGKMKSEGSKSHEHNRIRSSNSDSKTTKSGIPHIQVDTSNYINQGAKPKQRN